MSKRKQEPQPDETTVREIESIKDLTTDLHNLNKSNARGRAMLEKSLSKLGAGRSIVVDRDGVVVAGNQTLETAAELGLSIRVIQTDGTELIVHQRVDLDMDRDGGKARQLSIADNRTGEVSLTWEPLRVADVQAAGLDLSDWWGPDEIQKLLKKVGLQDEEEGGGGKGSLASAGDGGASTPSESQKYELVFEHDGQHARFYKWLKWLKDMYPDEQTVAGRVDAYLREKGVE